MSAGDGATKIYTRTGDKGKTSLIGGTRVSKSDPRLDAYGTVDELNSFLGLLATEIRSSFANHPTETRQLESLLSSIQNELFNVGSQLACEDEKLRPSLPRIDQAKIAELEKAMDLFSASLQPLKNFILPGGSRTSGLAHVARTVCRRAERHCVALTASETETETVSDSVSDSVSVSVSGSSIDPLLIQYLNRLSDFLFVLARHLNHLAGVTEPIWKP